MPKVAIITGASAGIGEQFARSLSARGYAIGLVARRDEELERVAGTLSGGPGVAWARADVGEREQVAAAFAELQQTLGPCELLVCNAGVLTHEDFTAFDPEGTLWQMRVNYLGAINAVEAVLPGMLSRGSGQLVAVSSTAAYQGLPRWPGYCASKAALSRFWESMRVELAPRGVHCLVVEPGYVATAMSASNTFEMPMLMSPDQLVTASLQALDAGRGKLTTPWPMWLAAQLGDWLPAWIHDRVLSSVPH